MSAICPYRCTGMMPPTRRPLRRLISFPAGIGRALLLQIFAQPLRVHVVGALVDVHKFRMRAGLRNGFGGGDEGVRHGDDDVAGLHARAPSGRSAARRCRC